MFTKEDEALHKGLIKLLDDATFELKAREVKAFAAVYSWAVDLPNKFKPKHEFKPENVKPLSKKKKKKNGTN